MRRAWLTALPAVLAVVALLAFLAPSSTPAASSDLPPLTVPALAQWRSDGGSTTVPTRIRIVVSTGDWRRLRSTAQVFAADVRALGRRAHVIRGPARQLPGDIRLSLAGLDRALGSEGYSLRVGTAVAITARTPAGVFYGTRTLLQELVSGKPLRRGRARDLPRYPVRGLMIDLGRRVYPAGWIEQEIRYLAYLKMNVLHLHLSDDQRWGIESTTHPEIVSPQALSDRDVHTILAVAARYHVTVVPEIDMPGHMGALLAKHPELELKLATLVNPPPTPESRKLDITSSAALATARELLGEYMSLFPGPYWDVGADEYLSPADEPAYPQLEAFARARYGPTATAKDAILGFVNWVDAIAHEHGKRLWAWHDELGSGAAVRANADILANWWVDLSPLSEPRPPTPAQLLAAGNQILNTGWFPTYYTEDLGPIEGKPDMRKAYETWQVNQFCSPTIQGRYLEPCYVIGANDPRNLGSTLNAWDDHELSLSAIADGIAPRLAVLAQKTWSSPPLTPSYARFQTIMRALRIPT
jgi:hexosaminidase